MKRREFILAGAALAATSLLPETPAWARGREVRLGMIGTGMRGQVLLKELLRRDDVDMVALCDIEPVMLGRATASRTLNALRDGGKKILGDKRSSPPARHNPSATNSTVMTPAPPRTPSPAPSSRVSSSAAARPPKLNMP